MSTPVLTLRPSDTELRAARLARFELPARLTVPVPAPSCASTTTPPRPDKPATPRPPASETSVATQRSPEPTEGIAQVTTEIQPQESVTSAALFRMPFAPEAVGRALVAVRGDADAALKLLQEESTKSHDETTASTVEQEEDYVDRGDVDEHDELQLALALSLEARPDKVPRRGDVPELQPPVPVAANPLWAPPRYMPPQSEIAGGTRTLNLIEDVEVRDGGYEWQRARAFCDTGNTHMTIVDTRFAARHAIYRSPSGASAALLGADLSFGQAERWTTLQGVVPGASSRVPCVTIALRVRDELFTIQAAVSEMGGHDLLLGHDVLGRLFASGFRIGAGSM